MGSRVWTGVKPEDALPEFPQECETDVVIIGAGPNGLIAGAYLSKAGLKTVICERRYEIGGGLSTEELLFPGNLTHPHAIYHMMVDYMPVLQDFNLESHGLTWIKPGVQTSIIFPDGFTLTLGKMLQDSKDSVTKLSIEEGERFEKVMRKWRRFVDEILAPATYHPPLAPVDFAEALSRTETGREFSEISEKSPRELLEEHFKDDRLKTLLGYMISMWGVDLEEEGMGFMVPLLVIRGMHKYYCYGGSHRFASALSREICSSGGVILENAEVKRIICEGKKAVGVELEDGRKIFSRAVLSSLPAPLTFFNLIGRENLPEDVLQEVKVLDEWKWDKWSFFTIHAVLDAPPSFKCDDRWADRSFLNIIGFENFEKLVEYFRSAGDGKVPFPAGHVTCETLFDETLSRTGDHVLIFQICAPYGMDWEKERERLARELIKVLEEHADVKVRWYKVDDPTDVEKRIASMVQGSIKHGDYTPLQMGYFRPLESCSSTRTPLEGLYLCGAGTYPGGLIIGGPGYICACRVVEDLGGERWWMMPPYIEKFVQTYVEV